MDTAPVVKNGRTYVLVRYVGELFGSVEWKDYMVFIYTNDEYKPSWRTDKTIQVKLMQGKTVKLNDVIVGLLEGSPSNTITALQEREDAGK